uniref:NADH-ubiquinone oxidoreductase chain 6 n=1 Tax=Ptecticus tenebrifer TaxID=653922 RepID=A0A8K1N7F0_9DIPT|nr:NADH dehydrogenase subunit 6 [Ptecticus tenebrifer]UCU06679.1 NADH dehydrogenase subunit 6 [Ptecticus tenebrifer]UHY39295.1 NADH dehydrogenase subunit 6 [Ptecticus tenebrifer]
MTQTILYSLVIMSSLIFMQMNHPLAMGLMLLVQSFLVCLITGMIFNSFWYSYILFLVFLGGMLILFIYVTSLASNEMFSFSTKMLFLSAISIISVILFMLIMDKTLVSSIFTSDNMFNIMNLNNFLPNNSVSLMNLYNFPTNLITIMLMNYLLLTLIVVVKITNLYYGPLRPMN